jgi:hypothetical protein
MGICSDWRLGCKSYTEVDHAALVDSKWVLWRLDQEGLAVRQAVNPENVYCHGLDGMA